MSFLRYPEYKDSGVEWLGEVPAHWQVTRVQDVAKVINGYPFDARLFDEEGRFPLVRIRDLDVTETATRYQGEFVPEAAVTHSDILIGMDGDFNVGRWRGSETALLNQRMCCVRNDSQDLTDLLGYALPTPLKAINDVTYATTVKHLSSFQVQKTRVAIPGNPDELSAVVSFLNHETAKIDALVAEQEKLIALLQEKRQAVISHAVTKGLNPAAPMKDSGIEWLGEVPAHWGVKRLRHISPQITVGIVVEPSKYYQEDGVPALRSLNVQPGAISMENLVFISEEANELLSKSQLSAGDLVSVRSGQPGTTAVVPSELDGCNCIDLIVIRKPIDGCSEFLCWYLASDVAVRQFTEGSGGAIQQHFNIGTAFNLVIPWPSVQEQLELVQFLARETNKLDVLVAEAENAVALLQERRSALISAAVTGKIDVRDFAAEKGAA